MQKSSHPTRNYRQKTWNLQEARTTLAQQMADHARGERLRQLRSERGLSQEDVAHALGVTAKTYGTWEKGGGIRAHNARLIARYFKVKPAELITPEIEPAALNGNGPASPELHEQLDEINRKLDEILRRLDSDDGQRAEDDEGPVGPLPGSQDDAGDPGQQRQARGQTPKRRRAR